MMPLVLDVLFQHAEEVFQVVSHGCRFCMTSRDDQGKLGMALKPTRRLTNFEYHNTMRDLLGIELELIGDLPKDPTQPYRVLARKYRPQTFSQLPVGFDIDFAWCLVFGAWWLVFCVWRLMFDV